MLTIRSFVLLAVLLFAVLGTEECDGRAEIVRLAHEFVQ